jgi:hypothetical protein
VQGAAAPCTKFFSLRGIVWKVEGFRRRASVLDCGDGVCEVTALAWATREAY